MSARLDTWIPDYAVAVPVTLGTAWNGPLFPLAGAAGCVIQIFTTNGAAGTLYMLGTNFDGVLPTYATTGNFANNPAFSQNLSIAVAANASSSILAGGALYCNKAWAAFNPSASGIIYVAVNIRRNHA